MLSLNGQIIGINTYGYSETQAGSPLEGLNFAISAHHRPAANPHPTHRPSPTHPNPHPPPNTHTPTHGNSPTYASSPHFHLRQRRLEPHLRRKD